MSIDLGRLHPDERVVYYRGPSLANERQTAQIGLADIAWQMAMAGELDLSQRRLPDGRIAYIATRRRVGDRSPVKPATVAQNYKRAAA